MFDNMDTKVNKLKEKYSDIFQKQKKDLNWAVKKHRNSADPVRSSIPFIGREYQNAPKKVLVYASAENLTFYCDEKYDSNYLDDDKYAENRHRNKFEETKEDFFPDIHIGPMNNGALATAALYICIKLGIALPENITPAAFYERIAVANYCKFSEDGKINRDYANDSGKLKCSKEYVKADLEVLKPDYIILPKTIYDNNECIISDYAEDNIKCIPIMQINQTTINCHIKKYKTTMTAPEGAVGKWYSELGNGIGKPKITGKTKENYMAVFDYLDTVLGELKLI